MGRRRIDSARRFFCPNWSDRVPRIGMEHGDLGEDIHDILSAAGARGAASAYQMANASSEVQIDLNDPRHLAELENEGLRAHMEQARAALALAESQSRIPGAAEIARLQASAAIGDSAAAVALKAGADAVAIARDTIFLQAANAGKLAGGGRPHGFPPPADNVACLKTLEARIAEVAADLDRAASNLAQADQALTRARRDGESAVAGAMQRFTCLAHACGIGAGGASQ